ncbi:50S ribosomal protein L4 [Candidatus Saccharibacteria bacterium]|nr:50S ribosomal protein L4 [Candidatus Saccharibacteria bacterium]
MKALGYSKTGNKTAEVTLSKVVFEREISPELLKTAYNRALSNIRTNNARTLKRGEVRGGGRKPWKQKGTGRARFGSTRVPIWRHGGVAFGPTGEENYRIDMPSKMIRASLAQALSAQAKDKRVVVIETFACSEGKVKPTLELLEKIDAGDNVLIVISKNDELAQRATRNIPGVITTEPQQLQVNQILDADTLIISKKALETIEQWLSATAKTKKAAKPAEVSK